MQRRQATPDEHDAIRTIVAILLAAYRPDQGAARHLLKPFLDRPDGGEAVLVPAWMFVARSLAERAGAAEGTSGEAVLEELVVRLAEPPMLGDE